VFALGGRQGGAGSLMADLEGFSCSDSEDEWGQEGGASDSDTDNQAGPKQIPHL
jgi:hypothetical protein